jgi:hypothetical protein
VTGDGEERKGVRKTHRNKNEGMDLDGILLCFDLLLFIDS